MTSERNVYLIDTNVISEARKKNKAHPGVQRFFNHVDEENIPVYLSVVTIGELRRGIEIVRHRSDLLQAKMLETWLKKLLKHYLMRILRHCLVVRRWTRIALTVL